MRTDRMIGTLMASLALLASCNDEEMINNPVPEEKPATLTILPEVQYQKVYGFGVMETTWTGHPFTDQNLQTLYGADEGSLGLNIMRVRIAPVARDADRTQWEDLAGIVRKAKEMGVTVLATPWTPPASLKTNNDLTGGELADYQGYAEYLASFLAFMEERGAGIDVLSIQNEPDIAVGYESCDWTGVQMADFLKQYGAGIKAAHPDVKLMTGESYQYRHEMTDPILEDEEACAAVDIVGGHIYGGGNVPYDLAREKGKPCWMTEYLLNEAWEADAPYALTGDVRAETIDMAESINACLASGMEAYVYWYGRRFYSMLGDGDAGSVADAVTLRGHIFSQFARNLTGKTRVKAVASKLVPADLAYSAYTDDAGNVTLMFINPSQTPVSGLQVELPFAPSSVRKIVTAVSQEPFPDTDDGILMESEASLEDGLDVEAYSIVTFVLEK